jgi:hypothetical protein
VNRDLPLAYGGSLRDEQGSLHCQRESHCYSLKHTHIKD